VTDEEVDRLITVVETYRTAHAAQWAAKAAVEEAAKALQRQQVEADRLGEVAKAAWVELRAFLDGREGA
jgi:hypothetical protein